MKKTLLLPRFSYNDLIMTEFIVKFKTLLNVTWGNKIDGKESFAFVKGFLGIFLMNKRRAMVVAEFTEKKGWFKKKEYHRIVLEAGLHEVKDVKMDVDRANKRHYGMISFNPHGNLGEGTVIQFLNMNKKMEHLITDYLEDLTIRNPLEDTGIILIDKYCPKPENWLEKRIEI